MAKEAIASAVSALTEADLSFENGHEALIPLKSPLLTA
jgi:hypothetical protein